MTTKRCYYETLDVARSADDGTIKSSFRKLAMKFHPDTNKEKDAEVRFKEINEAYQVLCDANKRAAYDRFGHAAFEGGRGGAGFDSGFASSMSDIFEEFFGDVMGRGNNRNAAQRGADLRYNLEITLEEAFSGKTAEIQIPVASLCDECEGSGAKAGTAPVPCPTCQGRGRVRATQGFFTMEHTCPTCHGAGAVIQDPCKKCHGAGRNTKNRKLKPEIPPGVEDGTRIRLAGEGEAGFRGGPQGDLYIFLSIKPHKLFHRQGADLYCRVPVSFTKAALGAAIEVPTIEGERTEIQMPAGTQTGEQLRVKAKGMPVLRSKRRGDLYVQIMVETPRNLNAKQRELLEQFSETEKDNTHPESSGFFARMREFFEKPV
ncbi:MAG: molecular chaperone DnaJ [Pseudomonadota bacterium]